MATEGSHFEVRKQLDSSSSPADLSLEKHETAQPAASSDAALLGRQEVDAAGYWDTLQENCLTWASQISHGVLWNAGNRELPAWRTEYFERTGDSLLSASTATISLPPFQHKRAERVRSKLLALQRQGKPSLPPNGPPVPMINDLVRTRIACRYIDGVEFLGDKLESLANSLNITNDRKREGRLDGYFAQHLVFDEDVFYRIGGMNYPARIKCEIQIASLLATRMWEVSHPYYEVERENSQEDKNWQWHPGEPLFLCRQLGHMIHLADGLLVHVRDANPLADKKKESQK